MRRKVSELSLKEKIARIERLILDEADLWEDEDSWRALCSIRSPIRIVGAGNLTVAATLTPLEAIARAALLDVPEVDGAYVQEADEEDEGITINVLAREHGLVNRERLFKIEDDLAAIFETPVTFIVRAHQGRDMRSMAGPSLLFARG